MLSVFSLLPRAGQGDTSDPHVNSPNAECFLPLLPRAGQGDMSDPHAPPAERGVCPVIQPAHREPYLHTAHPTHRLSQVNAFFCPLILFLSVYFLKVWKTPLWKKTWPQSSASRCYWIYNGNIVSVCCQCLKVPVDEIRWKCHQI